MLLKFFDLKEKDLLLIGHIFFWLLIIISYFTYQERLFADSSLYIFDIINYEKLKIFYSRYSSASTFIPSLISVKLGLSYKTILIIYSITQIFYYYLIYIIIAYVIKKPNHAFALVLIFCVSINLTFFWPVSELSKGMAACLILSALLDKYESPDYSLRFFFLLILVLVFVFYFHILTIIMIMSTLIFHILRMRRANWKIYFLICLPIILYLIKIMNLEFYEKNHMIAQWYFLKQDFIEKLYNYFISKYYILIFFTLLSSIYFIIRKEILILTYLLSAFIFYILFVNIYFEGYWNHFYTENLYIPLGFLMIGIFFPKLYKSLNPNNRVYLNILIFISIIIFFVRLNSAYSYYNTRVEELKNLIHKTSFKNYDKIVIQPDFTFREADGWSTSIETLVLSRLDNISKTFISKYNFDKFISNYKVDEHTLILCPWRATKDTQLNKKYFNFPTQKYGEGWNKRF